MLFSFNHAHCLLGFIVLSLLLKPVINYFRDPLGLQKYPAPSWLAALTPLWLVHATWSQNRSRIIHKEFQRLGDVVRVSPDHIMFNDPAAVKDIYGVLANSQGVHKDAFYDRVASDAHDLVQLRDRGEHSGRRKAIANAFAAKSIVNMESVIRNAFHQLLMKIDENIDTPITEKESFLNLRLW
jgi:benzoate 4-monooxygenase